jgi:hypothetical protein
VLKKAICPLRFFLNFAINLFPPQGGKSFKYKCKYNYFISKTKMLSLLAPSLLLESRGS